MSQDEIRKQAMIDASEGRYSPPGTRSIIGDVINAMLTPIGLGEDKPSPEDISVYDKTHADAKAAGIGKR
jgi:hypothetical protein